MDYRPEQRVIPTRLHTPAGWLGASFHVPLRQAFLDFLNRGTGFYSVTDVEYRGSTQRLPFLALQQVAVSLVIPPTQESQLMSHTGAKLTPRPIAVFLEVGVVQGSLFMVEHTRVSDFLANQKGFFLLYNCVGSFTGLAASGPVEQSFRCVLVNAARVVGASDAAPPPPART